MINLRPSVQKFAELMELELRKYDDVKHGWKNINPYDLSENASLHMNNFWNTAESNQEKIDQLLKVANYIMMTVENLDVT